MPGINVIDADGKQQHFADATTWHIDDRGQLHLKSDRAAIASFAKDTWRAAGNDESDEVGPSAPAPRKSMLTVREARDGTPSVLLGGLELKNLLLADGGFKIEYVDAWNGGPSAAQVTLVLAPGAVDFDLDVDMLRTLLDVAEREAADDE